MPDLPYLQKRCDFGMAIAWSAQRTGPGEGWSHAIGAGRGPEVVFLLWGRAGAPAGGRGRAGRKWEPARRSSPPRCNLWQSSTRWGRSRRL